MYRAVSTDVTLLDRIDAIFLDNHALAPDAVFGIDDAVTMPLGPPTELKSFRMNSLTSQTVSTDLQ